MESTTKAATKPKTKGTRLEARISARQKELFQKAAAIQGRTVSEFVVSAALEKAEDVIRTEEIIVLNEADRKVFIEGLLNPPKPNKALKKAYKLARNIIKR